MIDISQSDDFHDANLLSVELNLTEQRLVVRLDAHLSPHERSRTPVVLSFHGVRAFSATVDLAILHEHAAFGNISHWSPTAEIANRLAADWAFRFRRSGSGLVDWSILNLFIKAAAFIEDNQGGVSGDILLGVP